MADLPPRVTQEQWDALDAAGEQAIAARLYRIQRMKRLSIEGSTMTNETTASQPSIGDDAQFQAMMFGRVGLDPKGLTFKSIVDYIDSRAPAAQAFATIQAAPYALTTLCDKLMGLKRRLRQIPGEGQSESYLVADDVYCYVEEARRAATIQEPVMVADGTNWKMVMDLIADELEKKSNINEISQFTALCIEFDRRAAPMVADPAGVAVDREEFIRQVSVSIAEMDRDSPEGQPEMMLVTRDELQNTMRSVFDRFDEAATVKAVPSEALDAQQVRADEWRAVAAYLESQQGLPPEEMKTVRLCATVVRKVAQFHMFDLAAPLADKTGGGE